MSRFFYCSSYPQQFQTLMQFIKNIRTNKRYRDFSINFSCEGYLPSTLDNAVRDQPYFCRAGINIASILADGTISACPNICHSLAQGSIRDDDFVDVWEQKFQVYRDRSWLKTGPCSDCAHWNRCQGNSLHLYDSSCGHTGCCSLKIVDSQ